jgi:uncharacterized Zn-binding protein involved in type VI secretion
MPAISLEAQQSTGHGCFPPTAAVGPYTTKSFFNGKPIQLLGTTQYQAHTCGNTTHPTSARKVSSSSSTFYFEGIKVARIGDDIACGDTIAEGSQDSFIG